jgi:hypothetical protein
MDDVLLNKAAIMQWCLRGSRTANPELKRMFEPRPADTSEGAWKITRAAHSLLGPEGRLRAAFEASEFVRAIAREGIQARHPGYDDLQLDRALFRQIYGEALFRRVFPGANVTP